MSKRRLNGSAAAKTLVSKKQASMSLVLKMARWAVAPVCLLLLLTSVARADILTDVPSEGSLAEGALAIDQAFLKEAQIYVRENSIEDARESLKRYAEKKPDSPHPEIILAQLLSGLGRGAEAAGVIEALAAESPDRLDVRLFFAKNAIVQSRWFDAFTHLRLAETATSPDQWSAQYKTQLDNDRLVLKATYYENRDQWKEADAIYESLARAKGASAGVLTAFARVRFKLGDIATAKKSLSNAFKADPNRQVPELALALLYDLDKKPTEAEKQFQLAIKHPDQKGGEQARIAFARWLLWNNRPAELLEVLSSPLSDTSLGGAPLASERLLLLAMGLRMKGEFTRAVELLSPLHQKNPTEFVIGNEMAMSMIESKDELLRSRSLQIAQSMVRNNPNRADGWATLGWIQFRLGDTQAAKDSFSRAISGGTVSRDTAWHMSKLQSQLGNQDQADKLLKSAKTSNGPFFSKVLLEP